MNTKISPNGIGLVAAFWCAAALAQTAPGAPEDNGVTPKTATTYVNRQTPDLFTINHGNTQSLGVGIANGGNVIIGWEDDANDSDPPIEDMEAVWTMFDSGGTWITPPTLTTSLILGQGITNQFLSYFRADKSAVVGGTSWGPKIKANNFGDGIGMGGSSFLLGEEVVQFAPYDDMNSGDFPSLQLLGNSGQPSNIVAGVTSAYATADPGSIRIADWEFLSNGNVLLVDESRQDNDLISIYGGDTAAHHAIFRIVDPSGAVVKSETLVSDTPIKSEIWHGAAVTANGFAVRFSGPNGATVRMFDNAGNPASTNLELATLTGFAIAGGGGRGDNAGFHGNGKDAYVSVNNGSDTNGLEAIWVTVLNTNGTVRFSRTVSDDLVLNNTGASDAAIDGDGNVIVVYEAEYDPSNVGPMIMGRRFDKTGKPLGGTFYVSELEAPGLLIGKSSGPRVASRNGQVAVAWQSNNDAETVDSASGDVKTVVAFRLFSTFTPGSIESAGLTRIVPDTPVIKPPADSLGNWEPYASVLGDSTFLIEGNTFADDGTQSNQRYVVALQPAAGGSMKLGEGFYNDAGQPFTGQINLSRQNGNPGRSAGDKRPGAVNFMVGGETSVHAVTGFNADGRWNLGFDRLADGRYGTVQIYSLDPSTLAQTPLSHALDSANGRLTSGEPSGSQITRFGGEIAGLDNGNFVSVVEDRSNVRNPNGNAVVATIFAPDGSIVKDSFLVAPTADFTVQDVDIWSNVAAYQGGFAVRTKSHDGTSRAIYFYDNSGTLKGFIDQSASGASFSTDRGDGTRIFAHINSPYVFLTGRAANTTIIKVAVFDSRDQSFVTIGDVNEGAFTGDFDRAFGAVDALNRLTVGWVSQPSGYSQQQVAARVLAFDSVGKKITPLTPSFFPFINTATNAIHTFQMSVAMTTRQICVAAKGEISYENTPAAGPDSPKEVNFYTVFSHPAPQDDPTTPVSTGAAPTLKLSLAGSNLTISWDASATGFTLESKNSLTDAAWTTVGTQNPTAVTVGAGNKFYRLRK